jgi:hypothetical protein
MTINARPATTADVTSDPMTRRAGSTIKTLPVASSACPVDRRGAAPQAESTLSACESPSWACGDSARAITFLLVAPGSPQPGAASIRRTEGTRMDVVDSVGVSDSAE